MARASYLESARAMALGTPPLAWFYTAAWPVFTPPLTLVASQAVYVMHSHLEHHRPDRNCFRFYRAEVTRDLFGCWVLRCIWGRIGTTGRQRLRTFPSRDQAEAAQAVLINRKQRKGYIQLPEQMDLPLSPPANL
jgi:predicted DNA-binding WGR domain protein